LASLVLQRKNRGAKALSLRWGIYRSAEMSQPRLDLAVRAVGQGRHRQTDPWQGF
jgi:hypothetical protein